MRDYYSEPGLNPFKETVGQDATEHIDPFSGTLQLMYTDLVVPGNGGMDIRVHRVYTLPQKEPLLDDVVGIGWTMHFGRIVVPALSPGICPETTNPLNTDDNPSIEFPDSGRELLALNAITQDGSFITRGNWRAVCVNPANPMAGMIVKSPDGTTYTMDVYMQTDGPGGVPEKTWFTSKITDLHGNTITIE